MPVGPGKYDALCTEVRERAKARGAIVVIFEGEKGSGFSCQADPIFTIQLPELLEQIAKEMRRSGPFG